MYTNYKIKRNDVIKMSKLKILFKYTIDYLMKLNVIYRQRYININDLICIPNYYNFFFLDIILHSYGYF